MTRTTVFGPDHFTGTAGTALETYDSGYAVINQGGGYAVISASGTAGLVSFGNADPPTFRRTGTYTADQYALGVMGGINVMQTELGVLVRMSTDTGAGADYFGLQLVDNGAGFMQTELFKVANGFKTSIDLRSSVTWVNGDTLALEVTGSSPTITLTCYHNSTAYLTSTGNSGQDTGNPGLIFRGNSGGLTIDDYEAGNFVASSGTSLTPAQIALTLTGPAPTLARTANNNLSPAALALVLTGPAPTLARTGATSLAPGVLALTIAGPTPTLTRTTSSSGTITTPVLKNNTGTILASESGVVVNVYNSTTGALVVRKTGQTSNGSGIVTVVDALIVGGTTYAYEVVLASNGRRLPTAVAT